MTTLKMAVLAPIPSASVATATIVNAGVSDQETRRIPEVTDEGCSLRGGRSEPCAGPGPSRLTGCGPGHGVAGSSSVAAWRPDRCPMLNGSRPTPAQPDRCLRRLKEICRQLFWRSCFCWPASRRRPQRPGRAARLARPDPARARGAAGASSSRNSTPSFASRCSAASRRWKTSWARGSGSVRRRTAG